MTRRGHSPTADHDSPIWSWRQAFETRDVLRLVASLERYSKHPLAHANKVSGETAGIPLQEVTEICEPPCQSLRGTIGGHSVRITSRGTLAKLSVAGADQIPAHAGGLECFVVIVERYAAVHRF